MSENKTNSDHNFVKIFLAIATVSGLIIGAITLGMDLGSNSPTNSDIIDNGLPNSSSEQISTSESLNTSETQINPSISDSPPINTMSSNCESDTAIINSQLGTKATIYGPCEYYSFNDSPFYEMSSSSGDNFKLESFELDGELTKSGVKLITNVEQGNIKRDFPTNSVEIGGDSLLLQHSQDASFVFEDNGFGLPTYAGIVFTGSCCYGNAANIYFKAIGQNNEVLGERKYHPGSGSDQGKQDEDRFFGVFYEEGIKTIQIWTDAGNTADTWEVDHLQYGYLKLVAPQIPTDSSVKPKFYGPISYHEFADSPFKSLKDNHQSYWYFEDFEDGSLDVPIQINPSPGILKEAKFSVDRDDGRLDGIGVGGSLSMNTQRVQLIFNSDALGILPTHVGFVLTGSSSPGLGAPYNPEFILEAYDKNGDKIISIPGLSGGRDFYEVTDDKFFGVIDEEGIESVQLIFKREPYVRIDHIQYGR